MNVARMPFIWMGVIRCGDGTTVPCTSVGPHVVIRCILPRPNPPWRCRQSWLQNSMEEEMGLSLGPSHSRHGWGGSLKGLGEAHSVSFFERPTRFSRALLRQNMGSLHCCSGGD